MNTTTTEPISLKLSRLVKAPRERVFAAWTNPKEIVKWMGCEPGQCLSAKIDLRVGGEYQLRMKSMDSGEITVHGVYREIKPPARVVFTWTGTNCTAAMEGMSTVVTVDLVEKANGTEVQLTHTGFPTEDVRDRHNYGWSASLESLEKLV
jgi:uncharacterized protein YndB with AHSA1/START domain